MIVLMETVMSDVDNLDIVEVKEQYLEKYLLRKRHELVEKMLWKILERLDTVEKKLNEVLESKHNG